MDMFTEFTKAITEQFDQAVRTMHQEEAVAAALQSQVSYGADDVSED